jgi:hypothetical protein
MPYPFGLNKINYIDSKFKETPWIKRENFEVGIKQCQPRPEKKLDKEENERPRTPWTLGASQFKEYQYETDKIINDCFEIDWSHIKVPKLKQSDEKAVKERCRAMYPFLREVYRRLSAIAVAGVVFAIGWNAYRDFMSNQLAVTDH